MEQNPIQQQQEKQNQKVIEYIEETKIKFGVIFDEGIVERTNDMISQIERIPDDMVKINKQEVVAGLKRGLEIKEKEAFIANALVTLQPLFDLMRDHPREFEAQGREILLHSGNYIKLSEVLVTDLIKDTDTHSYIHLASATELIKEKGMLNFKNEVKNGLIELAKVLKEHENIEDVNAISWIVRKNPALLEMLGFTITDKISEEEISRFYIGQEGEREEAKAFMKRADFLNKYDNKNV